LLGLRKLHPHSAYIAHPVVVSTLDYVPDLAASLDFLVLQIHLGGIELSCIPPQRFGLFHPHLPYFSLSTISTAIPQLSVVDRATLTISFQLRPSRSATSQTAAGIFQLQFSPAFTSLFAFEEYMPTIFI
jgi:hypothetical protein